MMLAHPILLPNSRFIRLRDPQCPSKGLEAPVVAIGNFDGVHRGHQRVFATACDLARSLKRPAAALTFDPHPRLFFQPDAQHFSLSSPECQAAMMQQVGLNGVIVLSFDKSLASLPADAFIEDILIGRLGVSGIVAGWDFHFGKGRGGSPQTLVEAGKNAGIPVEIVTPQSDSSGIYSSSRIRQALQLGDITAANQGLGYEWFVRGPVIHGEKRGRDLGYPTANIRLAANCGLKHGIYAVRMVIEGRIHVAVASFGRRPTFDNGAPLLEVHVFDFKGDLYGKTVDVIFVAYLREEMKFTSIEDLVEQMDRDSAEARTITAQANI